MRAVLFEALSLQKKYITMPKRAKSINDLMAQAQRLVDDVPDVQPGAVPTREQQRALRVVQRARRYIQNIRNAMKRGEKPVSGAIGSHDAKYSFDTYRRASAAGATT